jgi:hypothetical protein
MQIANEILKKQAFLLRKYKPKLERVLIIIQDTSTITDLSTDILDSSTVTSSFNSSFTVTSCNSSWNKIYDSLCAIFVLKKSKDQK